MLIAFVHNGRSFLPEIPAYTDFFSARGIKCMVVTPRKLQQLKPAIAWHFMGIDRQKKMEGVFTVHEYTSASTPPATTLKNNAKRFLSKMPDHRVFLNEYVKNAFGFSDGVPYSYRDMGVPQAWLHPLNTPKEYDFIYVGELWKRGVTPVLQAFAAGPMKDHSVLVVSKDYQQVQHGYQHAKNIFFEGPVRHDAVRALISKSRYALNIMPDAAPFNQQTSTKLLEYCACKVPVVSSDYAWARSFQQKHGGKYFFLEEDLSNLSWDKISAFDYEFPDMSQWSWEKQIERSGIWAVVEKLLAEKKQH